MGLEVDVKLLNESEIVLEKLKTQNKIVEYLNTLKRIENYKIILRSVGIIDDLVNDAQKRNVKLDDNIVLNIN